MPFNRVYTYIKEQDPTLEPFQLEASTGTAAEAAEALGVEIGQIAKSILFRSEDRFGLFVLAGDVKVDVKAVKSQLRGKPYMASPEEVESVTGFPIGGVCPFALPNPVPILLDTSMRRFPILYTAAGTRNSVLPITFDKLKLLTNGIELELAKNDPQCSL